MRRLLTGILGGLVTTFSVIAATAADAPLVRIMPLGDSLTTGFSVPTYASGYRDFLYALLEDAGYNIDFVGTQVDTHNPLVPDPHHEGHGGFRIDQIDAGITSWLDQIQAPDVVLLMIGTNDFWQNHQPATAPARLQNLIAKIAGLRPHARIIVASIPPRTDSASLEAAQATYNAQIPGIVDDLVALGHSVSFVDVHAGLGPSDLSSDGVHLNQTGYDKVADLWLTAITSAISPGSGVLANGSFEFDLASWTSSGNLDVVDFAPFEATDGTKSLVFNAAQSTPDGIILQTFNTTVGQAYVLQFDVGVFGAAAEQRLEARVDGNGRLLTKFVSLTGLGGTQTRWVTRNYAFVANSATTTLTFLDDSTTTQNVDLMLDNIQVRPEPLHLLTVTSSPVSNVEVLVNPADRNAEGTDETTFTRIYNEGTLVHLSAPASVDGHTFEKWQKNGVDLTTSTSTSVVMDGNYTLNAVYVEGGPGAAPFSNGSFEFDLTNWSATGNLSVVSAAPFQASDGSKAIAFNAGQKTPNGVLSQTFQTTPGQSYALLFDAGAFSMVNQNQQRLQVTVEGNAILLSQSVTIAAPGNGTRYVPQSFSFTADSDLTTLTFTDTSTNTLNTDLMLDNVQVVPLVSRTLTVTSSPGSNVSMVVSPADLNGATNGSTAFSRVYLDGTVVQVTAPATANGNTFQKWQKNGVDLTTSLTATITMDGDHTLHAVYVEGGSGAAPFSNGSFELDLVGWTATGNLSVVSSAPFQASDGSKAVAFNGGQKTPNGVISQSFLTSPGQAYALMFDVGAFSMVNKNQQRLQVTVQGNSTLLSQSFTVAAPGNGTVYVPQSLAFTADSEVTTLTFADTSTNTLNTDLMLDNVQVVPLVSRTLTVTSSPGSNVSMVVTPADLNGADNGSTAFSRVYLDGTVVQVTAPATANGNTFQKWQKNGVDLTTSLTATVTMDGNHALHAVYVEGGSGAAPFSNGSFELDLVGWTATGNLSVVSSAPFQASDGSKAIAFNAGQKTPNGVLMQDFLTIPGQVYALTFDVGAFSMVNKNPQRVQVTVQGNSTLLTQSITVLAPGNGTVYVPQSFLFTADSEVTTLTFADTSTNTLNTDLMLDNVQVNPL